MEQTRDRDPAHPSFRPADAIKSSAVKFLRASAAYSNTRYRSCLPLGSARLGSARLAEEALEPSQLLAEAKSFPSPRRVPLSKMDLPPLGTFLADFYIPLTVPKVRASRTLGPTKRSKPLRDSNLSFTERYRKIGLSVSNILHNLAQVC